MVLPWYMYMYMYMYTVLPPAAPDCTILSRASREGDLLLPYYIRLFRRWLPRRSWWPLRAGLVAVLFVHRPRPLLALSTTIVGLLAAAAFFLPLAGPLTAVAKFDRFVELALYFSFEDRDGVRLALELLLGEGIHRF